MEEIGMESLRHYGPTSDSLSSLIGSCIGLIIVTMGLTAISLRGSRDRGASQFRQSNRFRKLECDLAVSTSVQRKCNASRAMPECASLWRTMLSYARGAEGIKLASM
ncbi:hypothetical protein BP00DRAFT_31225 [Aspergillus indologenus CBS 114.80]|uniref:Uncharacterized protein n=1 Tax=Aspergillus indologenus CBS 114.80 TaxID=1450541 RepID=A0A2V5HWV2_9EURO|nr:hypothetical protein BP00DRAFT_31225 [Aspergillus indologenus CBS 114.80]